MVDNADVPGFARCARTMGGFRSPPDNASLSCESNDMRRTASSHTVSGSSSASFATPRVSAAASIEDMVSRQNGRDTARAFVRLCTPPLATPDRSIDSYSDDERR